jgi:hypothetical protein
VEAPELDRFYRENSQKAGLLVVAVGDTDAAIRDLMASGGYTFPLMLDPGNIGAGYGVSVIPTLVIIRPSGKVFKSMSEVVTAEALADLVGDLTSP